MLKWYSQYSPLCAFQGSAFIWGFGSLSELWTDKERSIYVEPMQSGTIPTTSANQGNAAQLTRSVSPSNTDEHIIKEDKEGPRTFMRLLTFNLAC